MSGCATGCGTCGVRLRSAGRLHQAESGDLDLKHGERVVIQIERGQALGTVVTYDNGPKEAKPGDRQRVQLSRVVRRAKDEDLARAQRNEQRARAAIDLVREKLRRRRLDAQLVRAEYLLDGSRVDIFYLAEERHLPGDLSQELSIELKTQVDLRPIGPRDRVKLAGAVGVCGRETCCSSWMDDFHPVSVKMAKVQDFSLNETRLMGVCGRLKCCLAYENPFYEAVKRELPKIGAFVDTEQGEGKVWSHHVLKRTVSVRFEDGTQIDLPVPEGGFPNARRRPQQPPAAAPAAPAAPATAAPPPAPTPPPTAEALPPEEHAAPAPGADIVEPSVDASAIDPDVEGAPPDDGPADGAPETGPNEGGERRRRRRRRRRGGGGGGGGGPTGAGGSGEGGGAGAPSA